jgi:uncharacterized integral membrane protein
VREETGPEAAPNDDEQVVGRPEQHEGFRRQWQPRLYLRIVLLGLVLAYGTAFVLKNNKQVKVHFVLGKTGVSLIWLILLSVGLGLVLGVLLSQLYRRGRRGK